MQNEIIKKELVERIEELIKSARKNVAVYINSALLVTYMEIGKSIVEDEDLKRIDDEHLNNSLRCLSKVLTAKFGKGFSKTNLGNMMFYLRYHSVQSLSGHLSWTHYCELLSIFNDDKRKFYEKECENARWSVRELRRQIDSLYMKGSFCQKQILNTKK